MQNSPIFISHKYNYDTNDLSQFTVYILCIIPSGEVMIFYSNASDTVNTERYRERKKDQNNL